MNNTITLSIKNLLIGVLAIILVAILANLLVEKYSNTDKLSGISVTTIQAEINDKVKQLKAAKSKNDELLSYYNQLSNNINDAVKKLGDLKMPSQMKLDSAAFINSLNFYNDSINQSFFKNRLSSELKKILGGIADFKQIEQNLLGGNNYNVDGDNMDVLSTKKQYYQDKINNSYNDMFLDNTNTSFSRTPSFPKYSKEQVRLLISEYYKLEYCQEQINKWAQTLLPIKNEIDGDKLNTTNSVNDSNAKVAELETELKTMNTLATDKNLMMIALPVFSILILALFIIPAIYKNTDLKDQDGNDSSVLTEIFSKGLLLKIFTVFLLTIAIIMLAIGDKIKAETIGTLLGGISVYILQSSFGKQDEQRPPSQ